MKNKQHHYLKIVEWSKEDQCYVGTAPGLILGGVHGHNEKKVFTELCEVVEEARELLKKEGRPVPKTKVSKKYSGKILLRVSPSLHKVLALRAMQQGKSVNKLIQTRLAKSEFLSTSI